MGLVNGKRASFLTHCFLWGTVLIFAIIGYRTLMADWRRDGMPGWAYAVKQWEIKHTPDWFVHLLDFE